jgi:hypothetical protein
MGALCSRPTRDMQRVGRLDSHGKQKQLASLLAGRLGGAARDMHMCPKCNVPRAWWHVLQPKSRDTDLHTLHKFHRIRCTSTPRGCGQCDSLCSASRIGLRFESLLFYSKMRVRASCHPSSRYSVVTTNNTHSCPPIANILITACVEYAPRFYSSEQTHSQPHATLPTHYAPRCLAAHSTWSSANVAMK